MDLTTVKLIIPTQNAARYFRQSKHLPALIRQIPTWIIDSSSNDDTVDYVKALGAEVMIIPQSQFNHGATREWARKAVDSDIVVFLTQDAIPVAPDLIDRLIQPLLEDSTIAVSYGRQIPHEGSDIFAAFPREYNYGSESQIRRMADVRHYGVYTFFCSNSCAAWRNSALDRIGGFRTVLTNEDYLAVAELLQQDYKIAYVADAVVQHSHRYSLCQEFQRYFDTGYVRGQYPHIQQWVGQAESRGTGLVKALLKRIWAEQPLLLPYAVLQSLVKWLGYRTGFYGRNLPLSVKRRLSQQVYYWRADNPPD